MLSDTKDLRSGNRNWKLRRFLRLSLRSLLLLTLIFSVWLAWLVSRAHRQRQAVAAIREAGGWAYYEFEYSDGIPSRGATSSFVPDAQSLIPNWLADGIFLDMAYSVVDVDLIANPHLKGGYEMVEYSDPDWVNHIGGLPRIRKLTVKGGQINDSVLRQIGKLKHLEEFALFGQDSTNGGFTKLHAEVSNAGITELVRCKTLRDIYISLVDLNDESLEHLATLPNLKRLEVNGEFTDIGVESIKKRLPNATIIVKPHYLVPKNGE